MSTIANPKFKVGQDVIYRHISRGNVPPAASEALARLDGLHFAVERIETGHDHSVIYYIKHMEPGFKCSIMAYEDEISLREVFKFRVGELVSYRSLLRNGEKLRSLPLDDRLAHGDCAAVVCRVVSHSVASGDSRYTIEPAFSPVGRLVVSVEVDEDDLKAFQLPPFISVTPMLSFPTSDDPSTPINPYRHDAFHMGMPMGKNFVIMHRNHPSEDCPYLIFVNTVTGDRVKVELKEFLRESTQ